MGKLAIDIAILPPKEITDLCLKVNKKDPKRNLTLNKTNYLPHITLLMGVIKQSDIKKIDGILKRIADEYLPINLETIGFSCEVFDKIKICAFKIKLTAKLKKLRKILISQLKPYIVHDQLKKEMFFDLDIGKADFNYVKNYPKTQLNNKNYNPHITLHTGSPKYDKLPTKFTASKLALCLLGHFCTCRKILK